MNTWGLISSRAQMWMENRNTFLPLLLLLIWTDASRYLHHSWSGEQTMEFTPNYLSDYLFQFRVRKTFFCLKKPLSVGLGTGLPQDRRWQKTGTGIMALGSEPACGSYCCSLVSNGCVLVPRLAPVLHVSWSKPYVPVLLCLWDHKCEALAEEPALAHTGPSVHVLSSFSNLWADST